jgi:TolB protein
MLALRNFFWIAALLFLTLSAEEEIRVQLATESPLSPIYIGKLQTENCSFSPQHIQELEAILQFDFQYNGSTQVLPKNENREKILYNKDSKIAFRSPQWQEWGVPYVIRGFIRDKILSLTVFTVATGSIKHFNDIPLSGSLAQDRRQIHKAADSIYFALFHQQGIASTRILYSLQTKNSTSHRTNSEIWECDWDGANAHQITRENSEAISPVYMPDRRDRFLYVSYKIGQSKIYFASTQEGKGKRVIDLKGNQLLPALSPKKDKIAFISDTDGRTDLFIQAFHPEGKEMGKPVQLFSYPRSTQASPTFSPDASKIAFVSDKDGSPRIYVISTQMQGRRPDPVLISKQNRENSCPAWAPDGSKLAYSSKTDGVRQIWIYDFETKKEVQLTSGPGHKENPSWGRDSLHLVFNSIGTTSSDLFVINLNQPQAIKITKGSGKKHYPSWEITHLNLDSSLATKSK